MKVDKITLQVNGREMTFSEEKLSSILKEYYQIKETAVNQKVQRTAQTHTEGQWFEVNPSNIDQFLFKEKRSDSNQEKTRQLILEAFEELKKYPERNKAFKTLMPKKAEGVTTVRELKKRASELGNHIADWVEQALEWAQRIANGESWEDLCNKEDTAKWYRLVVWKKGYARIVGGSCNNIDNHPASNVSNHDCDTTSLFCVTVPLVVSYDV